MKGHDVPDIGTGQDDGVTCPASRLVDLSPPSIRKGLKVAETRN